MNRKKIAFTGSRDTGTYNHDDIRNLIRSLIILVSETRSSHELDVMCGDADGIDRLVQSETLGEDPIPLTVYSVGKPRNHIHGALRSDFTNYKERDIMMIDECDTLIAICINHSTGTMNNIQYATERGKKVLSVHL